MGLALLTAGFTIRAIFFNRNTPYPNCYYPKPNGKIQFSRWNNNLILRLAYLYLRTCPKNHLKQQGYQQELTVSFFNKDKDEQ
jgi:hypothetical protein